MLLAQALLGNVLSNWQASTLGDTGRVCLLRISLHLHTERGPLASIKHRTLWFTLVALLMHSVVRNLRLPLVRPLPKKFTLK